MKNQPYVKQLDEKGNVTNEIALDKPFSNNNASNRSQRRQEGKYIILTNTTTGEFMGKLKTKGNNRANTSTRKRTNSRMNNSNTHS